ncbi:MAG TPA: hypothetical protein VM802_04680 [Chitinophaga sp.]|uniref:hypothetical protein n=1 Tax=Chitinophaga sp. TaxID=1869181 RepID=UPI002CDF5DE7|nr:hypothetical protein [Chitinophaga sp.]HVI44135.1 hypothetical protein [Chitinophaga sp.]
MAIKFKITIGLLLIHLFTCYTTCRTNCAGVDFSFAIANRIYPDKDSINVGDTIWIEVDVPTQLTDLKTSSEVDYSGAVNLGSAIAFQKFDVGSTTQTGLVEAAEAFKTHLVFGEVIDNSKTPFAKKTKEFRFHETNGRYRFKAGFIATEKGDFMIGPGDANGVYRQQDKCSKASFTITIANTNQHLYLFQNFRPDYVLSESDRKHAYCMRVK